MSLTGSDQQELCDYCNTMCPPGMTYLWTSPLETRPQRGDFGICETCLRLAVEAAVYQETAPPPAYPRQARDDLRAALEAYSNGVKTALAIEEALRRL